MEAINIITIIISLLVSAFFSGIEVAFLASDRLVIELEKEKGTLTGKIFTSLFKKPSQFIGTALIGSTLALVLFSSYMTAVLTPLLHMILPPALHNDSLFLFLEVVFTTLIVLTMGEFLPKNIFLLSPNRLLSIFAVPLILITYLLYPVVALVTAIAKFFITKVLQKEYNESKPVFGLLDFRIFLKKMLESKDNTSLNMRAKIAGNIIDFKQIIARDCMIPRAEIIAVSIHDGINALKKAHLESEHSKILIYKNDIDDIIGYCSSKELFKKPEHIESILTPIIIVPETRPVKDVLYQFIVEHKSLALVVDEFGGTSGIIAIEDIIEEIFGEIQDEHDTEDLLEQQEGPGSFLFSARLEVDYLNEKYNLGIPDGDYDTLGGFITANIGRIPKANEVIDLPPFKLHILSIEDETHINALKLEIKEEAPQ